MAKKLARARVPKKKPPTKKAESAAMTQIMKACAKLGWSISFKAENEDDPIEYLIIGKPDEVNRLTNIIDGDRPAN